MGEKAEKTCGNKNLLELYAIFSSPVLHQRRPARSRRGGYRILTSQP